MYDSVLEDLKKSARERNKDSILKFVPTAENPFGVKNDVLNKLASKYKSGGFELVEKLFDGNFEQKLLAAKILGKIAKKDPERALKLIKKFANKIHDWAVCDTLATQGIRKIVSKRAKELFKIAKESVKSKNLWKRRFGIVLLISLVKSGEFVKESKRILREMSNEKEYYVLKAVDWLKRELRKKQSL